jgi:integrase
MPRKKNTRNAHGEGMVRQRNDGSWEYRYTAGVDPITGKQIRPSVYAKTEKEIIQKKREIISQMSRGVYAKPQALTVGEWLDIWMNEYVIRNRQTGSHLQKNNKRR